VIVHEFVTPPCCASVHRSERRAGDLGRGCRPCVLRLRSPPPHIRPNMGKSRKCVKASRTPRRRCWQSFRHSHQHAHSRGALLGFLNHSASIICGHGRISPLIYLGRELANRQPVFLVFRRGPGPSAGHFRACPGQNSSNKHGFWQCQGTWQFGKADKYARPHR